MVIASNAVAEGREALVDPLDDHLIGQAVREVLKLCGDRGSHVIYYLPLVMKTIACLRFLSEWLSLPWSVVVFGRRRPFLLPDQT
jgi:hypothetical protein